MLFRLRRFIRRLHASEKYDLSYIFSQAHPHASFSERVDWMASLVEWIRANPAGQTSAAARIRFILQLIERHPEWKGPSAALIRSVLREATPLRLYIDVGLPTQPTFGRELRSRLLRVFVPEFVDSHHLAGVQSRIFYEDSDPDWLAELPESLIFEVITWLRTGLPADEPLVPGWNSNMLEASRILAARSHAITLREDFERRGPTMSFDENPFARLAQHLSQLQDPLTNPEIFEKLRGDMADGRRLLASVRSHLEQTGISVDLVYQLDRVRNDLFRLGRLVAVMERWRHHEDVRWHLWVFWIELLRGHQRDGDFSAIFRKHVGLLSKKIVERTGDTGEHYIVQNRREYGWMLLTAAGGGALTALTAFIKYAAGPHGAPLFVEFLFNATNYSLSFLIMHFLGLKLATKQPSMTAAALAAKLNEEEDTGNDHAFVDEIARIARSQFAAVVGNLTAVVPVAWLLDFFVLSSTGNHFFSVEKAHSFLGSIDPVTSATLAYASLTGVLLWVSSMIAGWVENASVYARLPDVLRTHPAWRWMLGDSRAQRWADAYLRNVSGVVGSVALGTLLAMTPVLGNFFGLPLDARHVTLTTGSATYAVSALGWGNVPVSLWVMTGLGIFFIGLLNFGVSFALALFIAVRAREMPRSRVHAIFGHALRRLLKRPFEFLFPQGN